MNSGELPLNYITSDCGSLFDGVMKTSTSLGFSQMYRVSHSDFRITNDDDDDDDDKTPSPAQCG